MNSDFLDKLDAGADRRIRKTKKALREALFVLIEQKPINQITVKEITELADVNRSTFYLYYKDVFDMLERIQDDIYSIFAELIVSMNYESTDPESFKTYILRFLNFCKYNPAICRFVFRNGANNQIGQRLKQSIIEKAPDSHKHFPLNDPRHHLTTFALSGFIHATMEWIETGMHADIDDFARFLAEVYILGSYHIKSREFSQTLNLS